MNEAAAFRLITLIFVVLGFGTRIYFHRRAGTFQESFQQQQEGGLLVITGVLMAGWFVGMALFLAAPQSMAWSNLGLPSWLRWTGVALSLAGTPFFIWIHAALGRSFSGFLYVQEDHALVQEGPYRWIRHPMYTAYFLGHLGYLLITSNWFIGMTGLVTITLVMIFRVPREEAAMTAKFGDAYRDYARRTGKFLPKLMDRPDPTA